jgi:hypothetical protein
LEGNYGQDISIGCVILLSKVKFISCGFFFFSNYYTDNCGGYWQVIGSAVEQLRMFSISGTCFPSNSQGMLPEHYQSG